MNLSKALLVPFAFVIVGFSQEKAHAQTQSACSSTYSPPATVEERRSAGLFDGKVGKAAFNNSGRSSVTLTLYHPAAPAGPFNTYTIEAGKFVYISEDNYGSDWGIQLNNGPICILGKVSDWKISDNNRPYFLVSADLLNTNTQPSASSGTLLPSSTLTREEYFRRGIERYRNGDYQGAVEDWNSADNGGPQQLMCEVSYNRGNAYYKLGKYAEAVESYKKVSSSGPGAQFSEVYYNRAVAALALGDEEEAASAYTKMLEIYSLPEPKYRESLLKQSNPYLDDLEFSNLDGEIFPILPDSRWYDCSSDVPKVPKSGINTALNSCPKAQKNGALRKVLVDRLKKLKAEDMALQVQSGICPAKLH